MQRCQESIQLSYMPVTATPVPIVAINPWASSNIRSSPGAAFHGITVFQRRWVSAVVTRLGEQHWSGSFLYRSGRH